MLLTNNNRVDLKRIGSKSVHSYSDLHWVPIDLLSPITSHFQYERYVVSTFVDYLHEFLGLYKVDHFVHLPYNGQKIEPYLNKLLKPRVLGSIEIEGSDVLNVHR